MTVVGLHPEELFDKLIDGELTSVESERLKQHLRSCEVCRFEYAARLDFQEEALRLGSSPPPALPLRPLSPQGDAPALDIAPVNAPRRRARRRVLTVGIAAAALISASAAVAASMTGRAPWPLHGLLPSQSPAPQAATATAKLRKSAAGSLAATRPAPPPSVVTEPEPAEGASAPTPEHRGAPKHVRFPPRKVSTVSAGAEAEAVLARSAETTAATLQPGAPDSQAKEPSSAAKLFVDANQARRSGDFGRASGLYQLLQTQFPGSPEAELSRVTLALLQLDSGDARAALAGFERYLAGSSRGLEAEALVGRARALGRLGRRDLEVSAWQEVRRKYSRSIYGRQATERLSALGQQ